MPHDPGRERTLQVSRDQMTRLADEELMALVQRGDADAFEVLYDRHAPAGFSLAYRMVANRAAAEDVVQDALLSIWRGRAGYRAERGSVRTWMLGVVHNRAIDLLRRNVVHDRRRASNEGIEETEVAPERTEAEALRRDEARSVRAVLDDLPGDQLRVIELAYFGGFTHTEIAEMLDSPLGTVKSRMKLGLDKMRRGLEAVA
jgi:RNA polymerase sigma-70 factor, ECF subfamily